MAPESSPVALGVAVPGYIVEERIGMGGFGEVFRARHELIDREVAIKVLHAQYSADSDAVARFVAEARAVNRISHAGIVEIFDFGMLANGREYYVMELLRGKTLRDVLRKHVRLPLEDAVPILHGIAEAIDAAHAAGIAHRDLKPDNVFVLDDGRIKLIDFGLAKLTRESGAPVTETGSVFGTPLYMSPEQCRGRASDVRTDCYSFGVLAYHVLVGQPPFEGAALEIALQHLNEKPERPSLRCNALPERVDQVLMALLAKDPEQRPVPLRDAVVRLAGAVPLTREELAGKFLAELRATTAAAPGIAQVFDVGEHAPVVIETLDGESLAARLARDGTLEVRVAIDLAACVARTLATAHAQGFVHRDLTPDAIFLMRDGAPKVLDFGFTRQAAGTRTPQFKSPEQCRGDGEIDARADVYACGCVLFAALTGRPPFEGAAADDVIAMHLHDPPVAPSSLRGEITAAIDSIVLRCLAKRPAERFDSATALALALELAKPPQRSRRTYALFATAVVGLVIGGGAMVATRSDPPTGAAHCVPITSCPADVGCGTIANGCGGTVTCPQVCQLTGITPPLTAGGEAVVLQGTFGSTATVLFPGGYNPNATILGPNRVEVLVPANATSGDLFVTTGGKQVGPLPFRRSAFTMELQPFSTHYAQSAGARLLPRLETGRFAHASIATRNFVYVIGGYGNSYRTSVERASVHSDGTLGPFKEIANLTIKRSGVAVAIIGRYLYVIGGDDGRTVTGTIERAVIDPNGSLGPFTQIDVKMTERSGAAVAVIGSWLYVIGGGGPNPAAPPPNERAPIQADGSLGAFVPAPASVTQRGGAGLIVLQHHVYVVGGSTPAGALDTIERAVLKPDGTLTPFVLAPQKLVHPRAPGRDVVVIGNFAYVIGEGDGEAAVSVERASVDIDEGLGAFAVVPGLKLATPRGGATAVTIGNFVYVIGGRNNRFDQPTLEVASIDGSGRVGAFAIEKVVRTSAARSHHASLVVGNAVYNLGGDAGGFTLDTVERAPIAANGWLDNFAPMPDRTLSDGRSGQATAIIGDWVYLMGGSTKAGELARVERAAIGADRTLGKFTVEGQTLVTPRTDATSVAIGSFLYVIGGRNRERGALATIERAAINADGTLGAFADAGLRLTRPRSEHRSFIAGDYLYVLAGGDPAGPHLFVERAKIVGDTLGPFVVVPDLLLTTGRRAPAMEVLGNVIYLLGGAETPTIEHASIAADGSLGRFTPARSGLATPRNGATSIVIANYVYLIGGAHSKTGTRLETVERAGLE